MSRLPAIERFFGFDQIREVVAFAVDFLIVLVTFTGQHHHVVSTGTGDQLAHGGQGEILGVIQIDLHAVFPGN